MSEEMDFFIFLLEQYAQKRETTADKVLELWDSLQLTDFIFNMYERYHCEALDNAFADIDRLLLFEKFRNECNQNLPKVVDEILSKGKQENRCAIGLITTDDFYGFYITWDFGDDIDIGKYFEWEPDDISTDTDFLYQPLADLVDCCKEIDFCSSSKEKWDFAVSLLTVLQEVIRQVPDEVFQKNNFRREDVLFFATMGDGDYMYEMLDASTKMFNAQETIEAL